MKKRKVFWLPHKRNPEPINEVCPAKPVIVRRRGAFCVDSYPALKGDSLNISVDNSDSRPMAVGAALVLVEEFLNNDLDGYRFDELVS